MTKFDTLILLLTVLAVVLFVLMVREALRGTRAARHPQQPQRPQRRKLHCTYGAGYEHDFRAWEEDWEWERVLPPFGVQVRRATRSMHELMHQMGYVLSPAVRRATQSFEDLGVIMQPHILDLEGGTNGNGMEV